MTKLDVVTATKWLEIDRRGMKLIDEGIPFDFESTFRDMLSPIEKQTGFGLMLMAFGTWSYDVRMICEDIIMLDELENLGVNMEDLQDTVVEVYREISKGKRKDAEDIKVIIHYAGNEASTESKLSDYAGELVKFKVYELYKIIAHADVISAQLIFDENEPVAWELV